MARNQFRSTFALTETPDPLETAETHRFGVRRSAEWWYDVGATGEGGRAAASRRLSERWKRAELCAWRVALGLGVIALAGSLSVRRMSMGTPATETAMAASNASRAAPSCRTSKSGGQGGRPFKITTALGEFYFVADTEGISGWSRPSSNTCRTISPVTRSRRSAACSSAR